MAELISDGRGPVWDGQLNLDRVQSAACVNFGNIVFPRLEEHLLFEWFMCWWNEWLPKIEAASELETHFALVDEILEILLSSESSRRAGDLRENQRQQCLDRITGFKSAKQTHRPTSQTPTY